MAYTQYRVNGREWESGTGPITVTAQGTTTVAYYSVDGVGNEESVQTATIRLDSVAPSTSAEVITTTSRVVLTGEDGTPSTHTHAFFGLRVLTALVDFDAADQQEDPVLLQEVDWVEVKAFFEMQARQRGERWLG